MFTFKTSSFDVYTYTEWQNICVHVTADDDDDDVDDDDVVIVKVILLCGVFSCYGNYSYPLTNDYTLYTNFLCFVDFC